MSYRFLLAALLCVPLINACGAKSAGKAVAAGLPPFNNPSPGPAPVVATGKNNGKDFGVLMAGIIRHPYAMGVYQVVVYDEDQGSACYGLGDRWIKIPLDANHVIGTHAMKDNLIDAATFSDGAREVRVATGQIEVLTFDANGGTARINVGTPGTSDYLAADVVFVRCF